MKNVLLYLLIILGFTTRINAANNLSSMKAYYTRLAYEDEGYTGKFADIVIKIPSNGKLVFSREFGYNPYWEPLNGVKVLFKRIIKVAGLINDRPTDHNISCNASIVEKSDSSVLVHWRYAKNTLGESFVNFQKVYNLSGSIAPFFSEYVDEYFYINNYGEVRRIIKEGCYSLDEWKDPNNQYTQYLYLSAKGIEERKLVKPILSLQKASHIEQEIKNCPILNKAVMGFNFDDALKEGLYTTKELFSNHKCSIKGVKAYWEKGVSGSCLNFDSYSNTVIVPSSITKNIKQDLVISVWISPLEYPFNTAAIVDHLFEKSGYFLGLNRTGELLFKVGDGEKTACLKSTKIQLYNWTHVCVTYDSETKQAFLYINGALDCVKFLLSLKDVENKDMAIGKTVSFNYPYGAERETSKNFQTQMVFSGMIDELYIFDKKISEDEVQTIYKLQKPKNKERQYPYILPNSPLKKEFAANYIQLKYHSTWDNLWRVGDYADLVVTFENQPWRYVFWRGTRYLPSLVTDYGRSGIWSSDQGPEAFDGECFEHMSDMLCRFSNIRLIHNSPARIMVHWRNASVNINYKWPKLNNHGWGIWTDEYWTIYPDGTSIRHQLIHNSEQVHIIEMNQNEILHHPGQKTEELFYNDAVYVGDHNGIIKHFDRLGEQDIKQQNMNLLYTNLNSSTKQFQIGEIGTKIDLDIKKDIWWKGWDHYPCQLIPSDGTTVDFSYDRGGSSCVSTFREVRKKINQTTTEAMQIYGLTQKSPIELVNLNRYWNFTPNVTDIKGGYFLGFVKAERAYYLKQEKNMIIFNIQASMNSPMINPVFVIKKFKGISESVRVYVNNKEVLCKEGLEIDEDGEDNLVLWLKYESFKNTSFKIIVKPIG